MTKQIPDASLQSRERSVGLLTDMVAFWDAQDSKVAVPIFDGGVLTGVAIQAQVEHATRLTEAVLLLVRGGLFIQIAPLVRMAMECGVSAAWWTLNPTNLKGSLEEAARLKSALMKGMGNLVGEPNATHPDWGSIGQKFAGFSSGQAKSLEQRCRALAGGESLYSYYRLLSESSHGGVAIVDEYVHSIPVSNEWPHGVAFIRHAPYKYLDEVLKVNAIVLGLAFRAWDDFSIGQPNSAKIDAFAELMGAEIVVAPA